MTHFYFPYLSLFQIKKFHNERVLAFKDAMSSLAERQIENSTKMRDFLSQAISELQDI